MEKEALKYFLDEKIDDLKEILNSYANFTMTDAEFANSVWLSAEILAQKFRAEVVKFDLKEVESWA